MPTICYNCTDEITSTNQSDEHIIPNSIGGRLKSKKLLCEKCNKGFGKTIDAEFSKQLDVLAAFFTVKRNRQKNFVIKNAKTNSGDKYHLLDGRKPMPIKPTID